MIYLRRGTELRHVEGRSLVIGRSQDCDVRAEDTGVSRRHCEILIDGGGLVVRDLGSRHGTWVDGRPVTGELRVNVGAVVHLGRRGPQFLLAGAVVDGEPVGDRDSQAPEGGRPGQPRGPSRSPDPPVAPSGSPATRGFWPGLVTGLLVGVVAGLAALVYLEVAPVLDRLRQALGV